MRYDYSLFSPARSCLGAMLVLVAMTTANGAGELPIVGGVEIQPLSAATDRLVKALLANYRLWVPQPDWLNPRPDPSKVSTTLFDTVAVYLAFAEDLVAMEALPIRVTDQGHTVIDTSARTVHCAMKWNNLSAYEDLLVDILAAER